MNTYQRSGVRNRYYRDLDRHLLVSVRFKMPRASRETILVMKDATLKNLDDIHAKKPRTTEPRYRHM